MGLRVSWPKTKAMIVFHNRPITESSNINSGFMKFVEQLTYFRFIITPDDSADYDILARIGKAAGAMNLPSF